MKIGKLRNVKSLFQGVVTPIEITIRIGLTFIKQLSEILVAELNKLGIKIESNTCIKIITKVLDEYMQKSGVQNGSKKKEKS